MKKLLLILLLIHFYYENVISVSSDTEPQTVYRYIYEQHQRDWYLEQTRLWKNEIAHRPKDPVAWRNYFMANKYSYWRGELDTYKAKMDSILNEMGKHIPNSYDYYYLRFYNGEHDVKLLETAYKLNPKRPDSLYELVMYYEMKGDTEKLEKFCKDLYRTMDISPGLLDYNYNVLVSTEQNGILFTNGDNDTYPAWVLQHALDVRKDVMILNLHLSFTNREYLKMKLNSRDIEIDVESLPIKRMNKFLAELTKKISSNYQDIPIHVALTVYKGIFRNIEDRLYLVGLSFKYSMKRFDNIQSIKNNVYNELRLDYLDYEWYREKYLVSKLMDNLHVNYVVVFLKLAEDFHLSGNNLEARKWKNKALKIAKKANNEDFINHISELDW